MTDDQQLEPDLPDRITDHDSAAAYAGTLRQMIDRDAGGEPLPDDALGIAADLTDWLSSRSDGLTTPGGWCAPAVSLPDLSVRRGGIDYAGHELGQWQQQRSRARWLVAALAVVVYLGSVVLANWLTTRYGFIDVGWQQAATAGTFAAGGALVVRDVVQDALGRLGVLALIAAGALLSLAVADARIAWASAAAFLCAELLDMAAYTPLRRRGTFGSRWWACGLLLGAAVGAVADTVLFLWIAFGWSSVSVGLPGQLIAKGQIVLVLLALGAVVNGAVLRESLDARHS